MFPENDITRYGIDNPGDFLAKDITISNSYVDFKAKLTDKNERIKVDIPGRFTVYTCGQYILAGYFPRDPSSFSIKGL